jgi:hypothetical protein
VLGRHTKPKPEFPALPTVDSDWPPPCVRARANLPPPGNASTCPRPEALGVGDGHVINDLDRTAGTWGYHDLKPCVVVGRHYGRERDPRNRGGRRTRKDEEATKAMIKTTFTGSSPVPPINRKPRSGGVFFDSRHPFCIAELPERSVRPRERPGPIAAAMPDSWVPVQKTARPRPRAHATRAAVALPAAPPSLEAGQPGPQESRLAHGMLRAMSFSTSFQ